MPRAITKPCPRCGGPGHMVQLDSGHWLGACAADCGPEGAIHWSKVGARAIWNSYERPETPRPWHRDPFLCSPPTGLEPVGQILPRVIGRLLTLAMTALVGGGSVAWR